MRGCITQNRPESLQLFGARLPTFRLFTRFAVPLWPRMWEESPIQPILQSSLRMFPRPLGSFHVVSDVSRHIPTVSFTSDR